GPPAGEDEGLLGVGGSDARGQGDGQGDGEGGGKVRRLGPAHRKSLADRRRAQELSTALPDSPAAQNLRSFSALCTSGSYRTGKRRAHPHLGDVMRSHRSGILALLLAVVGPGLGASPAGAGYFSLYQSPMSYSQGLMGADNTWYGAPSSVCSADFNGDGYLDWVVTNELEGYPTFLPHTVSVFYHAGASYVPSIDFWTSSTQGSDLPPLDAVHYDYTVEPASNGPLRPKAADVNGDGRQDLVVGSGNGTFLLLNTGATGVSGSQF